MEKIYDSTEELIDEELYYIQKTDVEDDFQKAINESPNGDIEDNSGREPRSMEEEFTFVDTEAQGIDDLLDDEEYEIQKNDVENNCFSSDVINDMEHEYDGWEY